MTAHTQRGSTISEGIDRAEIERLSALYEQNGAMASYSADGRALLLWDDGTEIRVEKEALIDLLFYQRDHYAYAVQDARAALSQHGVIEDLPLADAIHLLVGRRERSRR